MLSKLKFFALKVYKSINLSWVLMFAFTSLFLLSNVQNIVAQDNPSGIYVGTQSEEGFVRNLLGAIKVQITGVNADGIIVTSFDSSAIGNLAIIMESTYENPGSSGIVWAQDTINQLQGNESFLVSAQDTTYFPGTGFELLRPILGFWEWARNIAYSFIVFILIIIAFLILFRQQLGGQTVITITNSLPSILVALFLITFSYPLSAFFIDGVTIGSNLVFNVLIGAEGAPGHNILSENQLLFDATDLQPNDAKIGVYSIWGITGGQICKANPLDFSNNTDCAGFEMLVPKMEDADFFAGGLAQMVTSFSPGQDKPLANIILGLILAVAALGAAIKITLALISNYIILTTAPIFSPIIMMQSAIPSGGGIVGGAIIQYFKTLLSATLTFIAIYAVFLFLVVLTYSLDSGFNELGSNLSVWAPPLIGYDDFQQNNAGMLYKTLVVYGLFLYSAEIPALIQKSLGLPTENGFFQTIIGSTTSAGGTVVNVAKGVRQYTGIK